MSRYLAQELDAGHGFFANYRPNYLRLTYSYNAPEEIIEGVSILADVFRRKGLF